MADFWSELIKVAIPAGASLLGGYVSGEGPRKKGEAEEEAAREAINLQRDIYRDQRGLAQPGYMTGGAATNLLASQYGIGPQDYAAAYGGGGAGGGYNPGNWGAGQPVAGHTGGGGSSGIAGGVGTAIGSAFGGPIGGAIGGALGGLVRKGGDNWQTLGTSAPGGYDYEGYFASDPGLSAEWAKPDVQSLFGGNRDAYAWWHYNNMGKGEGRTLAQTGGGAQSPQGSGGMQGPAANPLAGFMSSPHGQIATSGFRGVDVPEINGAFARGGKVLSGAQSIALDERGKSRLGGAYNDYLNGLRYLSGMNQTASSQVSSAAGQYGANAGNAMMAGGQAKGNALAGAYQGIGQGISGALGSVFDYGKKNWGWA